MGALADTLPHDYATEWVDELDRVVAAAPNLSPGAVAAVLAVVDSFASEDGFEPREAARARLALTGGGPGLVHGARKPRSRRGRARLRTSRLGALQTANGKA
jgi:hypothetical protein